MITLSAKAGRNLTSPEGSMWGGDPNPGPVGVEALHLQPLSPAGWLVRWVEGTLCQPWLIEEPGHGQVARRDR